MPGKAQKQGLLHHQAGRLREAIRHYCAALADDPSDADSLHLLGVAAHQTGKSGAAVELIPRAIRVRGANAAYYTHLGVARTGLGRFDLAVAPYRSAIALSPGSPEAYSNLGYAFAETGRAIEAATVCRIALRLLPNYPDALLNLGRVLSDLGQPAEAAARCRAAIADRPDAAQPYSNLGNALVNLEDTGSGIEAYRRATLCMPELAEAHFNLGGSLKRRGRLAEAVAACRIAISLKPDGPTAYSNLAGALLDLGNTKTAIAAFEQALHIRPSYADVYSNLLFLLAARPEIPVTALLARCREWERNCVPQTARAGARNTHFARRGGGRLKIGYVSGDFRTHAVSYFIEQIFANHDRDRVEIHAYSTSARQDEVTGRLRGLVEHWTPIVSLSDEAARRRILEDGIDVLIDLSGHTAGNRLGIFARRAAPVQAHYLGFFASTGLTEMDYWIGDPVMTPAATDGQFSETVWRLPRIWVSYAGSDRAPQPQARNDGGLWLGSFNRLSKLTVETFDLWGEVMRALPEARLLLKTTELADDGNRRSILATFADRGVAAERIELRHRGDTADWRAHMAYYDRLDIALDPVGGVGGGTTTCDALWMGLPVVALDGDRMASRMTSSMLDAIGHPDWVARDHAGYVAKVVELARDVEGRKALRGSQRAAMAASPLCDAAGLTRALEQAFAEMYQRYSERQEKADR